MNSKLVVVVSNDNACDVYKTIDAIDNAGFKNVFVQWYDKEFDVDQLTQVKLCKEKGFNIEFAHLGYQSINDIWTIDGEHFVDRYKKNILDCHNLGINMVVMHASSKWVGPEPNEIGLNRFKEIVLYAKSLNVKVALENTKMKGYIEYLINNINEDNLGICFDCGHYHCNQKDNWDITPFKDKVFCVHLHDNNGEEDQHLLPFDGTLDWNKVVKMLDEVNYNGPITMELCYRKQYESMSVEEFYKEGYQRGLKIANIL